MTDGLKPGWRRVKLGDVVRLNKESSKDPAADGLERYVGLEHLEPDDLRIRSWGAVADGITFTNRFRPGQVLFGKRRAYQRKVAVADFDGVCSGDIYVLEPKDPSALLPDLLPFICQTDAFFDHATGTSAGSLSPRTNWTSLADYEFALPPLEEQRRIIQLLCYMQNLAAFLYECCEQATRALNATLKTFFNSINTCVSLQTMCRPIVRGIDSPGPNIPEGVPYVRIAEMTGRDGIRVAKLRRTTKQKADAHPQSQLLCGDFVVALRGVVGLPIRVPAEAAGANLSRGTARVSVLPQYSADYAYWALRSPPGRREVLRFATGWKGEDLREITLSELRELQIPCPARVEQDRIAATATELESAIVEIDERMRQTVNQARAIAETAMRGIA